MLSVLIVDDHPLFADAMVEIIRAVAPRAQVTTAGSRAEAEQWCETQGSPDWVLLDLGLPDSTTHRSLRQLRDGFGDARVIVCSAHDDEMRVQHARQQGAVAFISKSERPSVIQAQLSCLLHDKKPPPGSAQAGRAMLRGSLPLSQRHCEIMELLSKGLTNKEIARDLGVSPGTVKVHVREIFVRLGARSRAEAVAVYGGAQPSIGLLD